jgi:hypothetical protein
VSGWVAARARRGAGTHEELLARRGFYHELYASQFEEALDPVA